MQRWEFKGFGFFYSLFLRINSGQFFPEIDGLRFIAIFSVLMFHIMGYLKDRQERLVHSWGNHAFVFNAFNLGSNGVELFFVISGFILAVPVFSKKNEAKILNWAYYKSYILKRITRLEPPYFIALFFFAAAYCFLHKPPIHQVVTSVMASMFYAHHIFFGRPSFFNVVLWTLEIEFQYYLICPLFLFLIRSLSFKHRVAVLFLMIPSLAVLHLTQYNLRFLLLPYFHFFLIGVLMCILHSEGKWFSLKSSSFVLSVLWLLFLVVIFNINFRSSGLNNVLFSLSLGLFFFISLQVKKHLGRVFLLNPFIFLLGGMCYSIYLLHYPLISFCAPKIFAFHINVFIKILILLFEVLFFSSLFYIFLEKPFMRRAWYRCSLPELYREVYKIK